MLNDSIFGLAIIYRSVNIASTNYVCMAVMCSTPEPLMHGSIS